MYSYRYIPHFLCPDGYGRILTFLIMFFNQLEMFDTKNYVDSEASPRPGQWETMKEILNGKDVLSILPTGSGKTFIFAVILLSH